jgi:hypothetical protein
MQRFFRVEAKQRREITYRKKQVADLLRDPPLGLGAAADLQLQLAEFFFDLP